MGIWMVGSALLFLIASYCLIHFGYKIDEGFYAKIEKEIKEREALANQEAD